MDISRILAGFQKQIVSCTWDIFVVISSFSPSHRMVFLWKHSLLVVLTLPDDPPLHLSSSTSSSYSWDPIVSPGQIMFLSANEVSPMTRLPMTSTWSNWPNYDHNLTNISGLPYCEKTCFHMFRGRQKHISLVQSVIVNSIIRQWFSGISAAMSWDNHSCHIAAYARHVESSHWVPDKSLFSLFPASIGHAWQATVILQGTPEWAGG